MAFRDIRPYMLHAHIQWLDDSDEKPHMLVLNGPGVVFPPHLRDSESLLFNLSGQAIQGLDISDAGVSFAGRFQGRICEVHAPLDAVIAVQNKAGTVVVSFAQPEEVIAPQALAEPPLAEDTFGADPLKKPHLSVVSDRTGSTSEPPAPATRRGLHLVKGPDTPTT